MQFIPSWHILYTRDDQNIWFWKTIDFFSIVLILFFGFDVQKLPIQLLILILIFNSDHPTIDIDFDVQKWPIQLLILILMYKSEYPTIDFDFDVQKWPPNYWFWFWCSKVTSSNFWFWFWTLNPTFDHVWCKRWNTVYRVTVESLWLLANYGRDRSVFSVPF